MASRISLVMEQVRDASPQIRARMAGVFYLCNIVTGAAAAIFVNRVYGNAALLIATASYVAVTLLFYGIFRPVSRSVSFIAALFSLAGCAISVLGLFHLSPGVNPLVLFGVYCLLIGYLIFRSAFLPRLLGALMAFAGLAWLTFVWPPLANSLSPYILIPGLIGEGSLTLWLVIKGVEQHRWMEQAGARS